MLRKTGFALFLAVAVLILALAVPAFAQDDPLAPIATGLINPRGLFYGEDGTLYITEAGNAGDETARMPFGPARVGQSSQVSAVPAGGGDPTVLVDDLWSMNYFDDFIGASSVWAADGQWWITLSLAPEGIDPSEGVLVVDGDGNQVQFIDFGAYEVANNPDGDDVSSNPSDITMAPDGTIYVADASANAVYTVAADGTITPFHVWEDLPVPTSVAVAEDGTVYVGFLGGFPFTNSRVEQWSPDGELVQTYSDLGGVTDVLVASDGTVYAVELADFGMDIGFWRENDGRVTILGADGTVTPVAVDINYPYALAESPEGQIVVTVNSAFSTEPDGMVVPLESLQTDMPMGGAEAPAATPEAES